jgi:23S rRNA G2069 N7-methylase RlmK/C1962 C5-methylase RlmI
VTAYSRHWAMPSPDTFSVAPIGELVRRYLSASTASIDPFARNNRWASATNDLNPDTSAEYHLDAEEFCHEMTRQGRMFDLAIFDPPYSPRQISECYKGMGRSVGARETQNAALYKRVRDALVPVLAPGATVLSFGWNSSGMGQKRGFRIVEIMLVAHGGAHNDTICLVEVSRHDPVT